VPFIDLVYASGCIRFNVPTNSQHTIDHFGDESFQSLTCTGTDNLTRTTKRQNKNKFTQSNAG